MKSENYFVATDNRSKTNGVTESSTTLDGISFTFVSEVSDSEYCTGCCIALHYKKYCRIAY